MVPFTVRENALTVGDLALSWGRPNMIAPANQQVTLYWPAIRVTAIATTNHGYFSYRLPFEHLLLLGGR
jgi:hypothetical protein